MDRLSTLLSHFGVSAGTFHSGTFCGTTGFDGEQACGHLHLLKDGDLTLKLADDRDIQINKPAKTGDAEKRVLNCEYTLLVNNEAAHGVAADLYGLTAST